MPGTFSIPVFRADDNYFLFNVGVSAEVAYYPKSDITTVVLCSSEQGAWGPIETIEGLVLSGALDNQ